MSSTTLPREWTAGEIAILGLARSGRAAAMLLAAAGLRVYASDAEEGATVRGAAEQLRLLGVDVQVGGHDYTRIARASLVVASPGIPPEALALTAARDAGVPIVGELEVALRAMPSLRYVAVTGSNGKTTTTALVGHLLQALGRRAATAGNIGTPLAERAMQKRPPEWVALEVSSFQLHDTPSIRPTVGVLTNLSPNHLDRYPGLEAYYGDKALLFRNDDRDSRWVLNADDADVMALPERALGRALLGERSTFSLREQAATGHFDRQRGELVAFGAPVLARADFPLVGDHNVANALAAVVAVMAADEAHRTPEARRQIADALRSFRALEHRIEPVAAVDGVLWINDSKSTSVAATLVALQGMSRPTILLLGGRHKGEPYSVLADEVRRTVRTVLAYGESAPIVEQDLASAGTVERLGSDFEEVLARARSLARAGDAVLLSPACSSYDMFDNYEQRGAEFKRLVGGASAAEARA